MELQHINVKLALANPESVDLEALIPVFHSWVQDQLWGELLLDVADYHHVYHGPGVILIGHEGNYSVDNSDGRWGVRYNRKAALAGDNRERLRQATAAALRACKQLENDPRLEQKLGFNGRDVEFFINDRLLAPNTAAAREGVKAELTPFLKELFGGSEYALSFNDDPRSLLQARAQVQSSYSSVDLFKNLTSASSAVA